MSMVDWLVVFELYIFFKYYVLNIMCNYMYLMVWCWNDINLLILSFLNYNLVIGVFYIIWNIFNKEGI